jgi:hypothetical protein
MNKVRQSQVPDLPIGKAFAKKGDKTDLGANRIKAGTAIALIRLAHSAKNPAWLF